MEDEDFQNLKKFSIIFTLENGIFIQANSRSYEVNIVNNIPVGTQRMRNRAGEENIIRY